MQDPSKENETDTKKDSTVHKCFILFCVIYVHRNAAHFNLHNYSK